jgi:hypothetical protein
VDLSDGGLQILTASAQALALQSYRLELVTGVRVGTSKMYSVHSIWSRPDGVNMRTGFAFDDDAGIVEEVGKLLAGSERNVLRCVLYPKA